VDRNGKELDAAGDAGDSREPALSPRGDRLAFSLGDARANNFDIWVRDLSRGVNSRLTFGAGDEFSPTWSPDGSRIVFAADARGLVEKPADGTGEEKELFKAEELTFPTDWSRDGRYIAFTRQDKETGFDAWVLPTFGDGKPIPILKTPFNEGGTVFSPDGRFVVYVSNESGRNEIYARSFPGQGGKWQVSAGGGSDPHFSADGREIFYRAPDQKVMAVDVKAGAGFETGVPKALFLGRFQPATARNRFVPAGDGQRFLIVAPLGRDAMAPTTIVLNWYAGL
jgi:Tol biopolymer transport system component